MAVWILGDRDDHNRTTPCLDLQRLGESRDGAIDLVVWNQLADLGVRNQQEVVVRAQATRSPTEDLNRGVVVVKDPKRMEAPVLDDESGCFGIVVCPDELADILCYGKEQGAAGVAGLLTVPGFVSVGALPTELLMDILRALEQNRARGLVESK